MLKPFNELYAVKLDDKISHKPAKRKNKETGQYEEYQLDYLSWPDCLQLLYENGAEKVLFGNVRSEANHPLFLLNGAIPFVRIFVDIDGDRREIDYPLIDGSKDLSMEDLKQSDVHNASQRAFVKCVAVNWGLGLSLWQKEEKEAPEKSLMDDPESHNLWIIKKRVELLITKVMQRKNWSQRELYEAVGMKESIFTSTMTVGFNNIGLLEQRLREIK